MTKSKKITIISFISVFIIGSLIGIFFMLYQDDKQLVSSSYPDLTIQEKK